MTYEEGLTKTAQDLLGDIAKFFIILAAICTWIANFTLAGF